MAGLPSSQPLSLSSEPGLRETSSDLALDGGPQRCIIPSFLFSPPLPLHRTVSSREPDCLSLAVPPPAEQGSCSQQVYWVKEGRRDGTCILGFERRCSFPHPACLVLKFDYECLLSFLPVVTPFTPNSFFVRCFLRSQELC